MFVFNGKKYARNDAEFVDTLFDASGTANGFYRRVKNGVKLYDMQHNLTAMLIANPKQGYFAVSASIQNGREWFMHSTTEQCEKWLGVHGMGMQAEHDLIKSAVSNH